MSDAELALLEAVRDVIRTLIDEAQRPQFVCNVEIDDQLIPAISGKEYIAVIPATLRNAPRHHAEGTIDQLVAVNVVVFRRATEVPRDRKRSVFMEAAKGISDRGQAIIDLIDGQYSLIRDANLNLDVSSEGQYIHPLMFNGTGPYQSFAAPVYASQGRASGDPVVGIKRVYQFTDARYMQLRVIE